MKTADYEKAVAIVLALYTKCPVDLETKRLDVTMAFIRLFEGQEGFRRNEFFDMCMRRVSYSMAPRRV